MKLSTQKYLFLIPLLIVLIIFIGYILLDEETKSKLKYWAWAKYRFLLQFSDILNPFQFSLRY